MLADRTRDPLLPPLRPGAALARTVSRGWAGRHRLGVAFLILLALAPVAYVLWSTAEGRRDLVYWDEFDTALALVVKLKEGMTAGEFAQELFALNNEHRMVTSRLLFATTYWLTGTINFTFIHWVGVAWVFLLCGILLVAARDGLRRLRLGLFLACVLFQLEHYENYLWSGSSIDHFQVVMLATGAIVALTRRSRASLAVGGLLAALATFTLAHGIMVWPVGAAMLWHRRERRRLVAWCGLGALAVSAFLFGFKVNSAESFAAVSLDGALQILRYWLAILGAVPALGKETLEPVLGGVLLLLIGLVTARGALRREQINLPLVLFAVAAAALIAVGRAAESGGEVYSRYYILSAMAWGLTLFMLLERHTHPRRPLRLMVVVLPALMLFNVSADAAFADETESWLESRNRAVTRFKQYGIDGRGPFTLHPNPEHATELLRRAEELGVYRLGPISHRRPFPPGAVVNPGLAYFVDEMTVNPRSLFLRGWVALPGRTSERGQIHLILRSGADTHLFTTVSISRPDVAQATNQPGWELSGFRFARRRDRLPTGEYQIGFLLTVGGKSEYTMTAHRVRLIGEGQALLATGN
jgi:hypothetical protein